MASQLRRQVFLSSRPEASQTSDSLEVKPLTQEAAGDLHTVVRIPEHREERRGKKYRSSQKHCTTFFPLLPFVSCFVYNKLKANFMQSSDHTEHHRK